MIKKELATQWAKSGISKGDVVLVHSSLKRTLKHYSDKGLSITPKTILESFTEAVGPSGTLLLPTFNFDYAKGAPFDIRATPSQMGKLTEEGRLLPDAVRTGHPIYSFVALGRKAERFVGVNNFSGYDKDSPFAILRELRGKIAALNLPDQNSMTFYHHVEEMHKVPYRYMKKFSGQYTDAEGRTETRTYGLYVRDLELGVCTHVDPAGELMWKKGLYSGHRPDEGNGLRVIDANAMYDFVSDIIESGRAEGLLYRIDKEACHV